MTIKRKHLKFVRTNLLAQSVRCPVYQLEMGIPEVVATVNCRYPFGFCLLSQLPEKTEIKQFLILRNAGVIDGVPYFVDSVTTARQVGEIVESIAQCQDRKKQF